MCSMHQLLVQTPVQLTGRFELTQCHYPITRQGSRSCGQPRWHCTRQHCTRQHCTWHCTWQCWVGQKRILITWKGWEAHWKTHRSSRQEWCSTRVGWTCAPQRRQRWLRRANISACYVECMLCRNLLKTDAQQLHTGSVHAVLGCTMLTVLC